MKPRPWLVLAVCSLTLLAGGCCRWRTRARPRPVGGATATVTAEEREMAALAFLAYTGELLTGSDDDVERKLAPCMVRELAEQPLTRERWQLAWGPAVYRFELGKFDDNMMFVVRDSGEPSHLAVVVRGTNAPAVLDWLLEDFEVGELEPWPYGTPPAGLKPKISRGTHLGLEVLQGMTPASGVPGDGLTLAQFLKQEAGTYPELAVDVTGHSLGGALAPTLALWLADTQAEWDPSGGARLEVFALAGPTAGDRDFARYSDQRLGAATHRLVNPFDVVPKAWAEATLARLPSLYLPLAPATDFERNAVCFALDVVHGKNYRQIRPDTPPLAGALEPSLTTFAGQAGWQHTCGYRCATGLVPALKPVSRDCRDFHPPDPCPVCPQP